MAMPERRATQRSGTGRRIFFLLAPRQPMFPESAWLMQGTIVVNAPKIFGQVLTADKCAVF